MFLYAPSLHPLVFNLLHVNSILISAIHHLSLNQPRHEFNHDRFHSQLQLTIPMVHRLKKTQTSALHNEGFFLF
jgi:hypothetical protein